MKTEQEIKEQKKPKGVSDMPLFAVPSEDEMRFAEEEQIPREQLPEPEETIPKKKRKSASRGEKEAPKAIKTATSVPRCSTIEIRRLSSPTFIKCWATERCPELETGRNSVKP